MNMPGGHSLERAPTDDEIVFLTSPDVLKGLVAASSLVIMEDWEPVLVTTQVVAGTNYTVKYRSPDGTKHAHAKIFKPLPCHPDKRPEVLAYEGGCAADQPLH